MLDALRKHCNANDCTDQPTTSAVVAEFTAQANALRTLLHQRLAADHAELLEELGRVRVPRPPKRPAWTCLSFLLRRVS